MSAADVTKGLYDTRVQGRNVFDWFIQTSLDAAREAAKDAARDAAILAAIQASGTRAGVDPAAVVAQVRAAADQALAEADFPTAEQIARATLDAQERRELEELRAELARRSAG